MHECVKLEHETLDKKEDAEHFSQILVEEAQFRTESEKFTVPFVQPPSLLNDRILSNPTR